MPAVFCTNGYGACKVCAIARVLARGCSCSRAHGWFRVCDSACKCVRVTLTVLTLTRAVRCAMCRRHTHRYVPHGPLLYTLHRPFAAILASLKPGSEARQLMFGRASRQLVVGLAAHAFGYSEEDEAAARAAEGAKREQRAE